MIDSLRRLYRTVDTMLHYRGTGRECPCCGGNFRSFKNFGVTSARVGARCPQCGALERQRLLVLFLRDQVELGTTPLRILHVAPETVLATYFAQFPAIERVTLDSEMHGVQVQADLQALPFPDAHFDAVICNHVLEHIPDDLLAMREIYRVMKPNGWAILQVPQDFSRATTYEDPTVIGREERLRAFGQEDHVRVYGRDYPERLRKAGFQVEQIPYPEQLGTASIERYGLRASEPVYWCHKPAQ